MSYLRIARREAVYRSEGAKDEAVQDEEEEVKATGDRRGTSRQLMRPVCPHMLQTPPDCSRFAHHLLPSFPPPSPSLPLQLPSTTPKLRSCTFPPSEERKCPSHCTCTLCKLAPPTQRQCHSWEFPNIAASPSEGALR